MASGKIESEKVTQLARLQARALALYALSGSSRGLVPIKVNRN